MSDQPPYPQPSERQGPDPSWPPPAPPTYGQQYPPGYYYPPPPRAYVPPGVTLASWGIRLGAHMIDGVIATVIIAGIAVAAGFAAAGSVESDDAAGAGILTGFGVYFLASLIWLFVYFPLTMKRSGEHNGQTWGKQMLSIRVVREDGLPMTAGKAIVRDALMKYIVFIWFGSALFYVAGLIDGLWPLWDERNQALHDKVVSTFVIQAA